MIIRGQKGQSSSVFNLLIAALVSIAILALLLTILGGVVFDQGSEPAEASVTALNSAKTLDYSTRSSEFTFSKKFNEISVRSLASKTDVGEDNIHLYVCEGINNVNLNGTGISQKIAYSGSADLKATVYAVCGSKVTTGDFTKCTIKEGEDVGQYSEDSTYKCHVIVGPRQ